MTSHLQETLKMFPLIAFFSILYSTTFAATLDTIYAWNVLTYKTPSGYTQNGTISVEKAQISGIDVSQDRIFLTVPKVLNNNPASLVYVPKDAKVKDPVLEAYPDWSWHIGELPGESTIPDPCRRFINVHRTRIDRCGRLWALDTGIIFYGQSLRELCLPKLIAFDLSSNQPVQRLEIPERVLYKSSLLTNFVIDDTDESGDQPAGNCDVGHIYISDSGASKLLVISRQKARVWSHTDPTFAGHPDHSKITVAGESHISGGVGLMGVMGLALSNPSRGSSRDLYYIALSSRTIYSINTSVLKNLPASFVQLEELPTKKVVEISSQSLGIAYDSVERALLFSPFSETALMAYPLANEKLREIIKDPVALQWVEDIKEAPLDDNNIWLVSSRRHKTFVKSINSKEVNQRVLRLNRKDL